MLATDVAYELNAIGQPYRDRCDCENGFDESKSLIKTMIANIQAAIAYVGRAEEQLPKLDRWHALVGTICERITGQTVLPTPPPALQGAG